MTSEKLLFLGYRGTESGVSRVICELMQKAFVVVVGLALASSSFAQAAQPDRSGEGLLKELMSQYQKRMVHWYVGRYDMESANENTNADSTTLFWWGGAMKFRLNQASDMGDGILVVSDGKTLMRDPLSTGMSIALLAAPKTLSDGQGELAPARSGSLLYFLFDGPDALDKVAPATASVKSTTTGNRWTIEVTNENRTTTWRGERQGNQLMVKSVETPASGTASLSGAPAALRRDVVEEEKPLKMEAWLFDPTPPTGYQVQDRRNQPGGGWVGFEAKTILTLTERRLQREKRRIETVGE